MQMPFENRCVSACLSLLLCACATQDVGRNADAALAVQTDAAPRPMTTEVNAASQDAGAPRARDAAAPPATAADDREAAENTSSEADEADDAGQEPPRDAGSVPAPPAPAQPCSDELQAVVGAARPDFGAAPVPPVAALDGDPNDTGAFGVWRADTIIPNPDANRSALDATFYAPSQDGGQTIAAGRFALVLVMHGYGLTHQAYEALSTHMASHGFVVLGLTLPFSLTAAHDKNAAEALAAIDFAGSAASPVRAAIDPAKIAVAGHSLGGKIAFYAAAQDARIDLVIAWDPSNGGGPPCFIDAAACNNFPVAPNCLAMQPGIVHRLRAESLVFRAAADGTNPEPAHNAIHFFRGAPAPATLVDFDSQAQHADWANPESAVQPYTRRVQLAFLRQRFYQHPGLDAWLPNGSEITKGAARALYKP